MAEDNTYFVEREDDGGDSLPYFQFGVGRGLRNQTPEARAPGASDTVFASP